jgi:hypothetical protein
MRRKLILPIKGELLRIYIGQIDTLLQRGED